MKGSEYLNNRKSELDSSGRIAEVVSNDEIAIALVYEANSKVSQRISELEKQLKAKDERIATLEQRCNTFMQGLESEEKDCENLHDKLETAEKRIAELERKGGDVCAVLGNLGIHIHDLGLRPTETSWQFRNTRAEAAEKKIVKLESELRELEAK